MHTCAASLQKIKNIAFRYASLDAELFQEAIPAGWTWEQVLATAKALKLPDGTSAVRSMMYGARMQVGTFGAYTGFTRHIEIAANHLSERSLATCFHEFAHALLHHDVAKDHYLQNEAWIESEADVTCDLVLMMLGRSPRRYTQNSLSSIGNVGDIAAFFHFAGDAVSEAAQTIYKAWQAAEGKGEIAACTRHLKLAA